MKWRESEVSPSVPGQVARLTLLLQFVNNLAAQKTFLLCFRRTAQSLSVLGLGSLAEGRRVSAQFAAPAPPPLAAASSSPSPSRPGLLRAVLWTWGPYLRCSKHQLLVLDPRSRGSHRGRRQTREKVDTLVDPGGRRGGSGRLAGRRHLLGSMGGLSPPLSFSALFSEKAPSLGCFSLSTGGEPQA